MKKIIIVFLLPLFLVACSNNPKNTTSGTSDKSISETNIRLGTAYMQDGQYERALKRFERARKATPREPLVYGMLGLLYQRIGWFKDSEKNFKQALRLDPENSSLLNNYGQMLCQIDRFEEAEKIFLQAANNPLYTNPEFAWLNAGLCAQRNKNVPLAESYYRRALDIDPQMPGPLLELAEIQHRAGDNLSALGFLQRYHQIATDNVRSNELGIAIYTALGRSVEAENHRMRLELDRERK